MNRGARRAFTLIDVMMTVAIIAIIGAVAAPSLRPNDSLKLISAATILTADLEFAQSATLEDPADPTVVRVDQDASRYWLAKSSDSETPIDRQSGGPYEVVFGEGSSEALADIGITAEDLAAGTVTFDSFGRLEQPDDIILTLTSPTGDLTVRIASSTGSVFIGK